MQDKFLPLGTVCLLKNAQKKIMIIGFCATSTETGDKYYDYVGCLYPEGVISASENLLFNHNQIDKVFFIGYSDQEQELFQQKLKEVINKFELSKIETLDLGENNINNSIYDMNIPSAVIIEENN